MRISRTQIGELRITNLSLLATLLLPVHQPALVLFVTSPLGKLLTVLRLFNSFARLIVSIPISRFTLITFMSVRRFFLLEENKNKDSKNAIFSLQKVEKHTTLAGQGSGRRARAPFAPPPPDNHDNLCTSF